jgi:hypothetical protein
MASKTDIDMKAVIEDACQAQWANVYNHCINILDEAEDPDSFFIQCAEGMSNSIADIFLQVARDAAADMIGDDSTGEGKDLQVVDTLYTLFAIPVLIRPGITPTEADFEFLAETLAEVTGDEVRIVPEIVPAEDFLAASPDAIRYAVSAIDWNRTFAERLDPLEHIIDRSPETLAKGCQRVISVIVGARVETFVGGTAYVPENWVSDFPEEAYTRFQSKIENTVFSGAECPMSAGKVVPTIRARLRLEDIINEIATIGNDYEVLPDVLVYEDDKEDRSFVALSIEGHVLTDTLVDRKGSTLYSGRLTELLRRFVPDVKQTDDAVAYTRLVTSGNWLN